jgi:hypothetical protein
MFVALFAIYSVQKCPTIVNFTSVMFFSIIIRTHILCLCNQFLLGEFWLYEVSIFTFRTFRTRTGWWSHAIWTQIVSNHLYILRFCMLHAPPRNISEMIQNCKKLFAKVRLVFAIIVFFSLLLWTANNCNWLNSLEK